MNELEEDYSSGVIPATEPLGLAVLRVNKEEGLMKLRELKRVLPQQS